MADSDLRGAFNVGVILGGESWRMVPFPVPNGKAEVTVRRLADKVAADPSPMPPAVCVALRVPIGTAYAAGVTVLRERWERQA